MTSITLYHAKWCPHCVTFGNEWKQIVNKCESLGIKATEYEETKNPEVMEANGITGYPTIKIQKAGKTTEYNGPHKCDAIMAALTSDKPVQTGGQIGGCGCGGDEKKSTLTDKWHTKYLKYKCKYMHLHMNSR